MDRSHAQILGNRLREERILRSWRQQDLADLLGIATVTIKRWERGHQQPGLYFRVQLCALFGKSAEELGFVSEEAAILPLAEETTIWSVPFPRNPFFTGRHHILDQLTQMMASGTGTSYAFQGLGGIGKTQLAIEYAHRTRNEYNAVLWADAETQTSLTSSFVRLAAVLALPEHTEEDQSVIVAATLRWLNRHEGWLLVLDNVEDLTLVKSFMPTSNQGMLLLTTQLQTMGLLAQCINLPPMDLQEGISFLLTRTRHVLLGNAPPSFDPEEQAIAQAIVTEMGGLPLALEQAGAYIGATRCTLQNYLRLFRNVRTRLLSEHEPSSDHPLSVTQTFALAFEQVQQRHELAAALLTACAFLAPEAIPEILFQQGASALGPLFAPIATQPLLFPEVIRVLLSYSLVQRNASTHTLTIHRLVQVVLCEHLSKAEQQLWQQRVLEALCLLFPSDEQTQVDYWANGEQLLAHAQVCLASKHQWPGQELVRLPLLNRVASYLLLRGFYAQAESLLLQALQQGTQILGEDHLLVAEGRYGLGHLRIEQGRFDEAEPLLLQALNIRERALGSAHPLVGTTLNLQGYCYQLLGKYDLGETSLQRALQINEQALGSDHPQVAVTCTNLGRLYLKQGKYAQAEPFYQRSLRIRKQALGPEHSTIASLLDNLGMLYGNMGNYDEAERCLTQSLQLGESNLGPDHPRLAFVLNNLGALYFRRGRYEETEQCFLRALRLRERQAQGTNHPYLALALANLGGLYAGQGKYEQAEPLIMRALYMREQMLGPDHYDLAIHLKNLGELHLLQHKYQQVEPLYQRALRLREQALDPDHPQIANILTDLGVFYTLQKKYEQAESFLQRALSILERAVDPDHPESVRPLYGLANLWREQGKYKQAGLLYQRVLHLRQQNLGAEHPYVAEIWHDLGRFHQLQHQMEEARTCYQQALTMREQILGLAHPQTQETREALARLA